MDATNAKPAVRPEGPLLWLHAPPPEERPAAAELIRRLIESRPDLSVLVTDTRDLPTWPKDFDDLPPLGLAAAPNEGLRPGSRFLDQWRPDLALFYPSTLPAGAATLAHGRGATLFLIARETPAAWRTRWRIGLGHTRRLLRRFERAFARNEEIAADLRALGLPSWQVSVCGPLFEGSAVLGCSDAERDALAAQLGGRPVWLAAATHAAEDSVVMAAHAAATRHAHRLLLILVPDDPARGPNLAERLQGEGWDVAIRSEEAEPEPETQVYIADTEGELGLWLRLASVSFLGGTLSANTGADPFCAAALGSAIMHGPAVGAYPDHYGRLDRARAARTVRDERSMISALEELLAPDRAATVAHAAWEVATAGNVATERVVRRLIEALDLAEAG